mmetsp:Transcript_29964/g.74318  ORF Transcript_29964/g.74318 Transcript_29964/m.74318 type:complete len:126 (-) Transcript_29964:389-766(-)
MHARTGEYLGYFFVTSTSLDEGKLVENFKERFKDHINIVSADNATTQQGLRSSRATSLVPSIVCAVSFTSLCSSLRRARPVMCLNNHSTRRCLGAFTRKTMERPGGAGWTRVCLVDNARFQRFKL